MAESLSTTEKSISSNHPPLRVVATATSVGAAVGASVNAAVSSASVAAGVTAGVCVQEDRSRHNTSIKPNATVKRFLNISITSI
ncbi:MAG: hypothetical protein ACD_34C00516G0001 [uncultured bacterium]|nr:MAG: hypothetical protein ACD_34C00516G0001 [uncultured bacterium]